MSNERTRIVGYLLQEPNPVFEKLRDLKDVFSRYSSDVEDIYAFVYHEKTIELADIRRPFPTGRTFVNSVHWKLCSIFNGNKEYWQLRQELKAYFQQLVEGSWNLVDKVFEDPRPEFVKVDLFLMLYYSLFMREDRNSEGVNDEFAYALAVFETPGHYRKRYTKNLTPEERRIFQDAGLLQYDPKKWSKVDLLKYAYSVIDQLFPKSQNDTAIAYLEMKKKKTLTQSHLGKLYQSILVPDKAYSYDVSNTFKYLYTTEFITLLSLMLLVENATTSRNPELLFTFIASSGLNLQYKLWYTNLPRRIQQKRDIIIGAFELVKISILLWILVSRAYPIREAANLAVESLSAAFYILCVPAVSSLLTSEILLTFATPTYVAIRGARWAYPFAASIFNIFAYVISRLASFPYDLLLVQNKNSVTWFLIMVLLASSVLGLFGVFEDQDFANLSPNIRYGSQAGYEKMILDFPNHPLLQKGGTIANLFNETKSPLFRQLDIDSEVAKIQYRLYYNMTFVDESDLLQLTESFFTNRSKALYGNDFRQIVGLILQNVRSGKISAPMRARTRYLLGFPIDTDNALKLYLVISLLVYLVSYIRNDTSLEKKEMKLLQYTSIAQTDEELDFTTLVSKCNIQLKEKPEAIQILATFQRCLSGTSTYDPYESRFSYWPRSVPDSISPRNLALLVQNGDFMTDLQILYQVARQAKREELLRPLVGSYFNIIMEDTWVTYLFDSSLSVMIKELHRNPYNIALVIINGRIAGFSIAWRILGGISTLFATYGGYYVYKDVKGLSKRETRRYDNILDSLSDRYIKTKVALGWAYWGCRVVSLKFWLLTTFLDFSYYIYLYQLDDNQERLIREVLRNLRGPDAPIQLTEATRKAWIEKNWRLWFMRCIDLDAFIVGTSLYRVTGRVSDRALKNYRDTKKLGDLFKTRLSNSVILERSIGPGKDDLVDLE